MSSPDGKEGYPGIFKIKVTYRLTNENELIIAYRATADEAMSINFTGHFCFNVAGHGPDDISGYRPMVNADAFTPVDSIFIPTGELRPVEGMPFDCTEMKPPAHHSRTIYRFSTRPRS